MSDAGALELDVRVLREQMQDRAAYGGRREHSQDVGIRRRALDVHRAIEGVVAGLDFARDAGLLGVGVGVRLAPQHDRR